MFVEILHPEDFFAGQHLVLHGHGGRWSADRYVAFVVARQEMLELS